MIFRANGLELDLLEVARFNEQLQLYKQLAKKEWGEILDKQGNKLRIELWREFHKYRWGGRDLVLHAGQGIGAGNTASRGMMELRARAARGRGTLVRLRELSDRWNSPPEYDKNGKPLTKWQKLVWQEMSRREAGSGVLGVGFLNKRWRYRQGRPRYLVENRSTQLGLMVRIVKEEDSFSILGFTPGLAKVSNKYGVVNSAIKNVRADIERYTLRKQFGVAVSALKRKPDYLRHLR